MAVSVSFHRWGLGFKQCSFRLIARALQDETLSVFGPLPLLRHALFPSGFRLQVNRMAQRYPSEPLLTVSRIQYRVPRRTFPTHTAPSRYGVMSDILLWTLDVVRNMVKFQPFMAGSATPDDENAFSR